MARRWRHSGYALRHVADVGRGGRARLSRHRREAERGDHVWPSFRAGDKVEVHTHGVWRKGSVRKVNYGRLCPGRPPDVRYDVHLESEGAWLPDELDHLKRVFKRVDEDGSGEIDRDELQKLLIELEHPLALDDYCVDDLFRRTDKDGSGHIDFPEFCDLVYVELHDDIGLPHTLYNVGNGVFPSILRRWRRWRVSRSMPPPRRFQQHRSPTAS